MDFEGHQEPQEPQEPQPPAAPAIDPKLALEIAAQQYGVTPDYLEGALRLQDENRRVSEENRRRQRELEVESIRLDAIKQERQRYAPQEPQYDGLDPNIRPLYEEVRAMREERRQDREEIRQKEENARVIQRQGSELRAEFDSVMRGVPSQSQVNPDRFFGTMEELWPGGLPAGVSPQRAVAHIAKYMGLQYAGGYNQPASNNAALRNPRAQFVVPVGSSASPYGGADEPDMSPQKPGETTDQYSQRIQQAGRALEQSAKNAGIVRVPDGKWSSG